jgi:hypothetical protein
MILQIVLSRYQDEVHAGAMRAADTRSSSVLLGISVFSGRFSAAAKTNHTVLLKIEIRPAINRSLKSDGAQDPFP